MNIFKPRMSEARPPGEPGAALPSYYTGLRSEEINDAVKDFDDASNLQYFSDAVTSARSRNFVLDFGDDDAWCGFDLEASHYSRLLKHQRPSHLNTRWIHIWLAHEQKELLTTIAKHFDFTPRMLALMSSSPVRPPKSLRSSKSSSRFSSSLFRGSNKKGSATSGSQRSSPEHSTTIDSTGDVEVNIALEDLEVIAEPDLARTMNQYALASDLWHYSTMDWGRRYVCLGLNSLYNATDSRNRQDVDEFAEDLPQCKRIWSWLILCEDKTVITIQEDPYPFRSGPLSLREQRNLGIIRRNMINVFRQCSKAKDPMAEITPLQLPLRVRVGDSEKESRHRASDVPGLLFYYLFDDWLSIYSIVARRDNRFAVELNQLRTQMLKKAELRQIDRLHHLGCQLAVLKRLYQSYELMIDRLLGRREISLASLQNSNVRSGAESLDSSHHHHILAESQSSLGVSLSSAAKVRFERLKHRVQLYALNEVNECLAQKDSLVMMNFNLLAIKEAFSVERLTHVTLLLAKVTLLFMPVSLMTAFFGCQFADSNFDVNDYWKWFGGVVGGSVVALALFSFLSGTTEGKIIVKPMTRRALDFGHKLVYGKRGQKMELDGESQM